MNRRKPVQFLVWSYFGFNKSPKPCVVNNFENIYRKTVEKTLKALSIKHSRGLFIRDIATYGDNKILNGYFSLMTRTGDYIDIFWEAYNFQKIKQLKKRRRLRK